MWQEAQEGLGAALHVQAVYVLTLWEPDGLRMRDRLCESLDEVTPRCIGVCPQEHLGESSDESGEVGGQILNPSDSHRSKSD
jgi:hypothetical protein